MGRIVWDYVAVSSVIAGISFIVGLKIVLISNKKNFFFNYFYLFFSDYAIFCEEKKKKLNYFLFICC